jgi:tetratricopeptide (TPR) repeat protein
LSQRQLSFEGCTPGYVSRIEAGERIPSLQILDEFAKRLGVDVDYLATGRSSGSGDDRELREAELASRLGRVEDALAMYERIRDEATSVEARARALAGLGCTAQRSGRHREAVAPLTEALAGDALPEPDRAAAADALGRAYVFLGEFESAFAVFERFLTVARERKDLNETIRFSVLLGNALVDGGNLARASEVLGSVISQLGGVWDPVVRAGVLWTQSRLHAMENRPDLASRYADMALELLRLPEHALYEAQAFQLVAHIENDRGHAAQALELVERGYPAVLASGNAFHTALFDLERARALLGLGRAEEAGALAMTVGSALAEASPADAGRGYALLADVFRELGDSAKALELYELATETLPGNDRYLVSTYSAMADVLESEGRRDEALSVLRRALEARAPVLQI